MRWALTIQPLTRTCANLAYFPCVHDTSSSYMPRAASYSLLLPLPICHRSITELSPLIRLMASPFFSSRCSSVIKRQHKLRLCLENLEARISILIAGKKKTRSVGERTPPFFIKRKRLGFSRPQKNPEPWPMSEKEG